MPRCGRFARFLKMQYSGGRGLRLAERGPMPLHLADIHLTRARLFHDPAAKAQAAELIQKHGYHRRDGELEDIS